MMPDRRQFLAHASALIGSAAVARRSFAADRPVDAKCRFGLVTYLWGKDLRLPDLLSACEQSDVLGVELRTTHKHGVELTLSAAERKEVRSRFNDSSVTLVGLGSDERFDNPDAEVVRKAIEQCKAFVRLSHDVGSSGVKVKGDRFYPDVPRDTTIAQVVGALKEMGDYADQFDQEIRLEVHGGFQEIPVHHKIISAVDHPRVRTCWNSNPADLEGAGLRANFDLVRNYLGHTAHVHDLTSKKYPWPELVSLFVHSDFNGWLLLEAQGQVEFDEVITKLKKQRERFRTLVEQVTAPIP